MRQHLASCVDQPQRSQLPFYRYDQRYERPNHDWLPLIITVTHQALFGRKHFNIHICLTRSPFNMATHLTQTPPLPLLCLRRARCRLRSLFGTGSVLLEHGGDQALCCLGKLRPTVPKCSKGSSRRNCSRNAARDTKWLTHHTRVPLCEFQLGNAEMRVRTPAVPWCHKFQPQPPASRPGTSDIETVKESRLGKMRLPYCGRPGCTFNKTTTQFEGQCIWHNAPNEMLSYLCRTRSTARTNEERSRGQ